MHCYEPHRTTSIKLYATSIHWEMLRNLPLFENVGNDKMLAVTASSQFLSSGIISCTSLGSQNQKIIGFSCLCLVFILRAL